MSSSHQTLTETRSHSDQIHSQSASEKVSVTADLAVDFAQHHKHICALCVFLLDLAACQQSLDQHWCSSEYCPHQLSEWTFWSPEHLKPPDGSR